MDIRIVNIKDIKPYQNNPRKNDGAVAAVVESIKQCGYCSPIVVDEDMVVLAGHTRLKAIKRLGWKECEVCVREGLTEEQKRKYRLLDNKTNELAAWDDDLLAQELLDLDFDGFDFDFDFCDVMTNDQRDAEFRERMESNELSDDSEEYLEFLEKFKDKKTTDDCYTPDNVYLAVRKWCVEKYGLGDAPIVRPFYPKGDYQREKYPDGCVVIDNPPFSILSEICEWYSEMGIRYFLFAPSLTLFSTASGSANYVVAGCSIAYENGACIRTSFVTNLGDVKILTAPELRERVDAANSENLEKMRKRQPKYEYPVEVITSAKLDYIAGHGVDFSVRDTDVCFIRALDAQAEHKKAVYGGGFLLSEKAAAEKAAAEKAAAEKAAAEKAAAHVWELSGRERQIIANLGCNETG